MAAINSAQGLISLFKEENFEVKTFAMEKLIEVVANFWHEIANHLEEIESLSEEASAFPNKQLAAYLASLVYFNLEEYSEALRLALEAGDYFNINETNQYVTTLLTQCMEEYIKASVTNYEAKSVLDKVEISSRMQEVWEQMFQRCYAHRQFEQAIGLAIESRRLDKLKEAITQVPERTLSLLQYSFKITTTVTISREFRREVITELAQIYSDFETIDYVRICECKFLLNDPKGIAEILQKLDDTRLAYQIAFDLVENQDQRFNQDVAANLPLEEIGHGLRTVLTGKPTIDTYLDFYANNRSIDSLLLTNLKNLTDSKNSICHSAVVFANSLMSAYTCDDSFLRNNLDWVAKATNWNKFNAVASLGCIHQGNCDKAMAILTPYLPGAGGTSGSPYAEGGALFALGLVNANYHNSEILNYLVTSLANASQNEVIQHGACLGIGLVSMATWDMSLFNNMMQYLNLDSAVAGEAASYSMGLIMLGSANAQAMQDMLTYAHETQHEKIIRALAIGLALIMYGKEEEADGQITQLLNEKDGILRYGGVYTMGLAYVGTSNDKIVKKLLHIAVSDVDYDVRRAAVTCIGLIMYKNSEMVPKLVSLLAGSYNPYVRQGAAMAIGIACAAKPSSEALKILETLQADPQNFVRQAGMIATAMVLCQSNPKTSDKLEEFKEKIDKVIKDKAQDVMGKMGAIVSFGILNAAGRNATISLQSKNGNNRCGAIVGMTMFMQFWYWHSLLHFLPLCFQSTSLIGITDQLKIPKSFSFLSKAKPSTFAYPPNVKPPAEKEKSKLVTAKLSTTDKTTNRPVIKPGEEEKKEEEKAGEEEKKEEEKKEEEVVPEEEPEQETLNNPSRVLPAQESHIQFFEDSRYVAALQGRKSGILLLNDLKPDEPEEYLETVKVGAITDVSESEIPAEFVFDPEAHRRAYA